MADSNVEFNSDALMPGLFDGLTLEFVGVDTITIKRGKARDDGNSYNIFLTNDLNITLSGDLDTGDEAASTWYYVWLIGDSTQVLPAVGLFSVSATAPTFTAGYDRARRLGMIYNDNSSNLTSFIQDPLDRDSFLHLVDVSGASKTITLPAAASSRDLTLTFKKIDSSTKTLTVDGNGDETIDGSTTKIVDIQYDSIKIASDGSNWFKWEPQTGLQYGEISVNNNSTQTAIETKDVKVQVTVFDTNGVSNGSITPDHTNDHITIGKTGVYFITCSLAIESIAGTAALFDIAIYKNNGATGFSNLETHRNLSGGGGDQGSASISGIANLSADDTIELWVMNRTNTQNIIFVDTTISILSVSGI